MKRTIIEYVELENRNIQIMGWKNVLPFTELPEEYQRELPIYYLCGDTIKIEIPDCDADPEHRISYLTKGWIYSVSDFKIIIFEMRKAGERLSEINKRPKIKQVII